VTTTFRITPDGEFSLTAAVDFLSSFTPADYLRNGDDTEDEKRDAADPVLRLAFPVEQDGHSVGVAVRQGPSGVVLAELSDDSDAADPDRVRSQVARILSLDVDAHAMRDAVAGDNHATELVDSYSGLRPVCFNSPYEAACWAVLSNRIRMSQAATMKTRISRDHGTEHVIDGVKTAAFPAPKTLLDVPELPGVSDTKVDRLKAVARAALEGLLDGTTLRALDPDDAVNTLGTIPGIGPFGAELILVRGAGAPDRFPRNETRLHKEMATVYGLKEDDVDAMQQIADGWRPYRSWVSFYFRRQVETHKAH